MSIRIRGVTARGRDIVTSFVAAGIIGGGCPGDRETAVMPMAALRND